MSKKILIDGVFPNQTRVALVNANNILDDIEYESSNIHQIKGNIYLAKIVRVEPGLQAAFIDYGGEKNGFLPFSEIHPGYYNIPIADTYKYTSELSNLQQISPPKSDIEDSEQEKIEDNTADIDKEIDISFIEKMIDEEPSQSQDTLESDLDKIDDKIEPLPLYKQYKIQDVIKKGQIILVQALKEERGNKGASFTSYVSLAGKYCVLMPNNPGHHGISRRITNGNERRRLRDIISNLLSEEDLKIASVIMRTAGTGRTSADIRRDYEYLVRLWNLIREQTLKSKAPSLIHIEEAIIQKAIRDLYDSSVQEIIIDGEEAFKSAIDFMAHLLPKDVKKIKKHGSLIPIFSAQNIESQVASLYQQTVCLPSGGYIVINPTEALTSIDVNSGRSTSEKNIEETALKTNVEAAKEIARQLRIRDISGLIVIDFIDMYESRNRKIVERSLKEYLSRDRAKIQLGGISTFGLLEMSRQRMRPSFLESHTKMCSHCNGKGIVRDEEANSMVILRTLENEIHTLDADIANIYANSNIILYLLNNKRFEIASIEDKYGIKLNFLIDHSTTSDGFSIEKISLGSNEKEMKGELFVEITTKQEETLTSQIDSNPTAKPNTKPANKRRKWKDSEQKSEEIITTPSQESENIGDNIEDSSVKKTKKPSNKKRTNKSKIKKEESNTSN